MTIATVDGNRAAPNATSSAIWSRWDVALGLALTAVLLTAHVVAYLNAGALWRDEVHSVINASHPSVFESWTNDSFPVLWLLVLRGWIMLGFGESDAALRGIGLLCGMLNVFALWWTGRQFGARVPWAMLVLLGFQPTLIVFGDEVRGYGIGVLTQLLMVACVWRVVERPNWTRFLWLQLAALLAVQAVFANSFMLLAACVGGGLVCLRRRDLKTVLGLLAVGLIAAASVAPYAVYVFPQNADWSVLVRTRVPWSWQFGVLGQAMTAGGPAMYLVWPAAVGLALWAAVSAILRGNRAAGAKTTQDLALFLMGNALVGLVGFWWYIRFLQVPTQVWYYLPLMALLAVCVEIGSHIAAENMPSFPRLYLATAALVVVSTAGYVWPALAFHFTNVDLVAELLDREVRAGDLVVVVPWYVGLTFDRYYRGVAPAMDFPEVDRQRYLGNGYIGLKNKMQLADPIRDELLRIASTLRSGRRVWLVGSFHFLPHGVGPQELTPAPHRDYGWSEGAYLDSWSQQAAALVQSRATSIRLIFEPEPAPAKINAFENVPLFVIEGWREGAP